MASSSPSLCQHSQCDAFQFTICRHCQLFLCIKHLAEHQQQFPSDFQRLLDDARRQQAHLSTFDTRTSEQRLKFNQTYEHDLTQYSQLNPYVQSKISHDDIRSCLNRSNTYLPAIDKIGQFLHEHDPTIQLNNTPFDEESLFASFGDQASLLLSPVDYISSDVNNKLPRFIHIRQDQNSSSFTNQNNSISNIIKETEDDDDDLPESDVNQIHNSLTVRELKTHKCDYCPLSTNTYGIEPHHEVRHIPCIRRSTSQISLFEHLKQYHYLNYAASMQIVRLVSSGDLEDHPKLFSLASQSSIVSILPSFFRAPCPLTQHHVFGLGPMHGIRLCSPSTEQQDFALYDHFLAFHQLNRASAMKLVKAMMNNENSSQRILFRPDEQVLNETAYVSCPLSSYDAVLPHQERIPHTPCQSTVKLRYLTGHLRDVHHLNKVAAKRIASALRHEQANTNGRSIGLFERDENILKAKKKKIRVMTVSTDENQIRRVDVLDCSSTWRCMNANRFRPPTQLVKTVEQTNHNPHQQPPPPSSSSIW